MAGTSVGFVGTVGGIGTTRTIMEIGGVLARNGKDVVVIDLDFATQGLARHVEGSIPVDSAALLADPDVDIDDAMYDWPVDGEGQFDVIPARSPFVTIAEAKTERAGARVADRLAVATERADWVLIDVPPVVSNQAIGAVTAADDVIAVIAPGERGVDALQRERGRLEDVQSGFDAVISVGSGDVPPDADVSIPALPTGAPAHRPATLTERNSFTEAVVSATDTLFSVSVRVPETNGVFDRLRARGERIFS